MKSFIMLFVIGVTAFLVSVALVPFSVTTAAAQEKAESAAQEEEISQEEKLQKEQGRKAFELEAITVTAQKQEENVQDVPVSITVFGEQDIEDKKIESVWEIADFVPNLMFFDTAMTSMVSQPTMRGVSAPSMSFTTSIGLYVDGVPTLSSYGFEEGILDIERIEVLRGPQGTLYGKNTETGVINIITRQPDNTFRGKVSAQGGKLLSGETGDKQKGEFSLNMSGPILKDKLFLGIAGQYYKKDGFVENTVTGDAEDDRERWFGRAHLRWTPADDLNMSLIVSRLNHDDGGSSINLGENGAAMFRLSVPPDRKVSSNAETYKKSDNDAQSLKITYNINDALRLTSVTARKVTTFDAVGDFDLSSATLMHTYKDNKYSKISQELRLDSSSEKLKWLVGLYYDKGNKDINADMKFDISAMVSTTDREFDGDAYAVFGQISYALMQRLNLVGGLRYEKQKMEFQDHVLGTRHDDSWDEISPKIALEYRFTPAIMTYASASKGYRSGGFNVVTADPQYVSYDAETLWSYEIGVKSTFLDKRIMLNGSVYYMDIADMQVEEAVSPFMSYTTNAAEATAIGGELEITAKVADGVTLMAGLGYSDIEFDSFKDAKGDYEGNKTSYAPDYTFNIGAQYRYESGFYARADLIGYGKMYFVSPPVKKPAKIIV